MIDKSLSGAYDATVEDHSVEFPELLGCWFYPFNNGMHKQHIFKIFRFGWHLRVIVRNIDEKPRNTFKYLAEPLEFLRSFIDETRDVPLPNTRNAAIAMQKYFKKIQRAAAKQMTSDVSVVDGKVNSRMKHLREAFEEAFEADSDNINVLSVPNRCAYSTTILIDRGEEVLPESVRRCISSFALNEVREAAKCIAFGARTAAGYHLMRALEEVVRRYY